MVISWDSLDHFLYFTQTLIDTALPKFSSRASELYDKSGHLRKWINQAIVVDKPIYEIAKRLRSRMVGGTFASPVNDAPYIEMMNRFIQSIRHDTLSNSIGTKNIDNLLRK